MVKFVAPCADSKMNFFFTVCGMEYNFKRVDIETTVIDFIKHEVNVPKDFPVDHQIRELLRAFFIIAVTEMNLNREFSNGRHPNFDDTSYAILSINAKSIFNSNKMPWEDKECFPRFVTICDNVYKCSDMVDISMDVTQNIQLGISDHTRGIIKIIKSNLGVPVPNEIRTNIFWHEYMHCLLTASNENEANKIEYLVDNLAVHFGLFMKQFKFYKD